eukprot:jgi/Picsp_1/717/NSC_04206-R1_nucleolysin tiar-like
MRETGEETQLDVNVDVGHYVEEEENGVEQLSKGEWEGETVGSQGKTADAEYGTLQGKQQVRKDVKESEDFVTVNELESTGKIGEVEQFNNQSARQEETGPEEEDDEREDNVAKRHDTNKSTLYLGNLHPFVTDLVLQGVFAGLEGITELKVIKDKATGVSAGYGFARFLDREYAQIALARVKGCSMFGQQMKVNWALQKEKEDELGNHYHIFVGDLSQEVTDNILLKAFSACPGCSDARVMWDHATGRSRGYGFVSFESKEQAQYGIDKMDGAHVGARCIRCGWAQHKTEAALPTDPNILDRSDPTNTNIYVGNLPANLSDSEMRKQFSEFGTVVEMKLHRKGNYGFVRYRSHMEAVQAIVGLNGQVVGGRQLKCSWGRHPKVPPSGVKANLVMAAVAAGVPQVGMGVMPHAQPMMAHQRPPSMVAQMPHGQMMGQVPDAEHALMQGVGGMSLYGAGQGLPPMQMSQEVHVRGGQLQPHQLDPSRQMPMYGMPPSSRYPDAYNIPQPQYNNPGNQYFQK